MSTTAAAEPKSAKKTSAAVQMVSPKVLAADCLTALFVGGLVACPVSIIDFSIMAKVSGLVPTMGQQVVEGTKTMLTRPTMFFLHDTPTTRYNFVFRKVAGVYIGTYLVANTSRSILEGYQKCTPEQTAYRCGVSSSIVNIALTIWKDTHILKVIPAIEASLKVAAAGGVGKSAASASASASASAASKQDDVFVPMLSRCAFAVRDALTCAAAFTVVPLLKDYLKSHYPDLSERQCQSAASLLTPCAVQLVSTNIHVPAIVYQRMYKKDRRWGGPEGYLAGMAQALKTDYMGALRLRVLRIFFAFGLGTVLNAEVRPTMIRAFEPAAFDV